jgi:hypothetical protein
VPGSVYLVLSVSLLLAGLVSLVLWGHHLACIADSVRPGRKVAFYLLLPFWIWVGPFLDDDGSYHRRRLSIFVPCFLFFMGLFAVAVEIHGPL